MGFQGTVVLELTRSPVGPGFGLQIYTPRIQASLIGRPQDSSLQAGVTKTLSGSEGDGPTNLGR